MVTRLARPSFRLNSVCPCDLDWTCEYPAPSPWRKHGRRHLQATSNMVLLLPLLLLLALFGQRKGKPERAPKMRPTPNNLQSTIG